MDSDALNYALGATIYAIPAGLHNTAKTKTPVMIFERVQSGGVSAH